MVVFNRLQILNECERLANSIKLKYGEQPPLVVVVREGGVHFANVVLAQMTKVDRVDVVCKSYSGSKQTGDMGFTISDQDRTKVYGREVLILDDIVDSGNTFRFLNIQFNQMGAKDVQIIPLILRTNKSEYLAPLDFGFRVSTDKFLVGFGMDLDGKYRDLPFICDTTGDQ